MEFTDYYGVLGVARDAEASRIKTAYRQLARKLHPDVNKDPGADARFKKINEAYEVLKDPEKRAKYDRLGANWEELERQEEFTRQFRQQRRAQPSGTAAHSDFFETFFADGGVDIDELFRSAAGSGGTFHFQTFGGSPRTSQSQPLRRRGRDAEEIIDVGLEEAARGAVRLLQIGPRQVEVRIPAGVTEGSRVRVAGEGGQGSGGGDRGDLFLRVHLRDHPRFTVSRRDLRTDLPVPDHVAVLGGEAEVQGLLGPLSVSVPPGTPDGRTMRLRGKGLPGLRDAAAGDLLLTVRITVPTSPSEAERDLYRSLAQLRTESAPAPQAAADA
jgi:DnaJ-class molecular chaperone